MGKQDVALGEKKRRVQKGNVLLIDYAYLLLVASEIL